MATIGGYNVVTDGLVLSLDAANRRSYVSGSSTWFDVSGNRNSGSFVNGPTFNSADLGSIVFDGTNDYINYGDPSNLVMTNRVSIEAWINGTQWTGQLVRSIVSRWGLNQRSYKISIIGDFFAGSNIGCAFIDVSGTGNDDIYVLSTTPLNLNTWYHIVGVYTGTSISIYVNGVNLSGNTVGTVPPSLYSGISSFTVGTDSFALANEFQGRIASVKVYNSALSAQEVLQNYNAQKGRFGL